MREEKRRKRGRGGEEKGERRRGERGRGGGGERREERRRGKRGEEKREISERG